MDSTRQIHLNGSPLGDRAHICAFFDTPDESYRVLLPFIKEGLEAGHKSVHTINPRSRADHTERLASAGIPLDAALRTEQLEVLDWTDTHLAGGEFDRSRTLSRYGHIVDHAVQHGFALTRFLTDMSWALEVDLDANALLEYEAMANYQWMRRPGAVHPVICSYDLRLFTADVIVDVIRTHPMVIIGGMLRENPFFVSPEDFLEQLRHRKPAPLRKAG